ncbi:MULTISPECIES: fumarylacetoacetate hydrolase family protein [unclassified Aureispira]|uniref:fumarylacetoacetate hydrolase family protein n=1 Tax=unclassified Aureispira TaxID=2649989 RepID=UPI000697FC6E|nr:MULTISPECIES: fumarylacetoacetate hydrolase family protein [unclassified Aureispira]WMX14440.1 fumarylacetoacetate hydrolase family protein [Aureispira sp. CCB-E]
MKIICVGRNYAAHAAELNNPVPQTPLLFLKPDTAQLLDGYPLFYPDFTKDLHYEVEVLLKICKNGKHIAPEFASTYYKEVSVGIDFTARDIQDACKKKGHPWEIAKAWNHSAAIGRFIPIEEARNQHGEIEFSLTKNGETVQQGISSDMLTGFDDLIAYISKYFMLLRGDVIFTGTPKGVGPVQIGDKLEGFIGKQSLLNCSIK